MLLREHPWLTDLPLYLVLLVPPGLTDRPDYQPVSVQLAFSLCLVLPLLWRRRHPFGAAAVIMAVAWAQYFAMVWGSDWHRTDLVVAVALYTLVVQGRRRQAALLTSVGLVLAVTWSLTWFRELPQGWYLLVVSVVAEAAIAWLLGEFIRARRDYVEEFERRAALAESERAALARAAVAEERTHIARELHDVVAHAISVIVVNAEGAKLMRHNDPSAVDRTLDTVSRTGRAALGELRRLLEVLHDDETTRGPQPSLAELTELVARAGAGRSAIALDIVGDPEDLPASAALQTYRIVQESLTNVIKHAAPDAGARVGIDFGLPGRARVVRIEVVNDAGARSAGSGLPSSGHGLAGMRQRVALFHGTLDAGPGRDGGFVVRAMLPITSDEGAA
ncbi:sensor histidine kinase [Solihabitans fulvus]|uniref:histidine kinase n=1 Tax=Solihabitans fulvus TaxID=1892852 RepID=A0A5B2WRQ2_9PSEU|nr:sensor histidine kinase [Solihabitans fulvus]